MLVILTLIMGCNENKIIVSELKCEYLINPLGIDIPTPRLSWELKSDINGQDQTAYQIIAASASELLESGNSDLWNSKKIQSGQSVHIKYEGKELKPGMQVFWKVRVWDNTNHPSGWSETAKWEMGLMSKDWQAKWVGSPVEDMKKPSDMNPAYYFRKSINLSGEPNKARAYISGLGYYELYINGKKIGDHVLSPNHTNYSSRIPENFEEKKVTHTSYRVLYEAWDITPYLTEGENTLAVCLGNGWYFQNNREEDLLYNYGTPRFISRFEIKLSDDSKKTIVSDNSWKTSTGPIIHNGVYTGEIYDARLEEKGWNSTGFDDHDWKQAIIVTPPEGKLQAQLSPPDRIIKIIHPVSLTHPEEDVYRFDLGQMISGWARINLSGPRGTSVKMNFIEEMGPQYGQTDTYILKGGEKEIWEPRLTWHAFRYVEVKSPIPLTLESLDGIVVNTDVPQTGIFHSSNALFNKINENFVRTQAGNMHGGVPSDCPHRERRGYTGDGQIAAPAAIYNFDMASFYTKWLNDISDGQNRKTGYVPNTVPYQGGGGGTPWGSAYVIISWYMYLYYGDMQILEQHYSGMKKWVNYLEQQVGPDGILAEKNLGEWVPPEKTEIPPSFVSTAYYYHNLKLMAEIAGVLHKDSDSNFFYDLAEKTKKAFHKKYYHPESKSYSIGRQGANVFPLGFGMVPAKFEKEVFQTLVHHIEINTQGHFDTGMMGTPLLLQVLTKYGRTDLAFTLMSQWDFPGFGYQIGKGATTIWETWKGDASHSHPMFGSACEWFYNSQGGINADPEYPGFKHIIIKPKAVANLKSTKVVYTSIYGKISSSWELTGKDMILDVTIPPNTSAAVFIPAKDQSSIKNQKNRKGITFIELNDQIARYHIKSGSYHFVSTGAVELLKESMLTAPRIIPSDTVLFMPDTGKVIILTDRENTTIRYTLNGKEPEINSTLYKGVITLNKNAVIKARVFKQGLKESPVSTGLITIIDPEKNGINYSYYTGEWTKLPDFNSLQPVSKGKLYEVSLENLNLNKDKFALVLSGKIKIPSSGEYTFYLNSNDGSRLFIDHKLIVSADGLHGALEKKSSIWLSQGYHLLKIHYFQAGGGYLLEFSISGKGIQKRSIPSSMLFINND